MSENNSNSRFMTVRQVAEYMQLNEKKICPRDRRKNSSNNGEFFRMIRGHCIFVNELLAQHSMKINDLSSTVKVFSNRETAALIVSGQVDTATGTRSVATEFGLAFVELGWEALDFAVRRDVYFRKIFQIFLEHLRSQVILKQARQLGG